MRAPVAQASTLTAPVGPTSSPVLLTTSCRRAGRRPTGRRSPPPGAEGPGRLSPRCSCGDPGTSRCLRSGQQARRRAGDRGSTEREGRVDGVPRGQGPSGSPGGGSSARAEGGAAYVQRRRGAGRRGGAGLQGQGPAGREPRRHRRGGGRRPRLPLLLRRRQGGAVPRGRPRGRRGQPRRGPGAPRRARHGAGQVRALVTQLMRRTRTTTRCSTCYPGEPRARAGDDVAWASDMRAVNREYEQSSWGWSRPATTRGACAPSAGVGGRVRRARHARLDQPLVLALHAPLAPEIGAAFADVLLGGLRLPTSCLGPA